MDVSRDADQVVRVWLGGFMLDLDDDIVETYIPWVDGDEK